MSQPVYVIGQIAVKDYGEYLTKYGIPVLEQLSSVGAEVIVGTPEADLLEGEWSGNWTVVLKFPDPKTLKEWYNSDAYAPLRRARIDELSVGGNLVVVPGFDPGSLS